MKIPHLLASFAVAISASAADLKDPSEVAAAWAEVTVSPKSLAGGFSLRGAATPPAAVFPQPQFPVERDKLRNFFQVPPWGTISKHPGQTEPLSGTPRAFPTSCPTTCPQGPRPGSTADKLIGCCH
jgi:hypothetical protein